MVNSHTLDSPRIPRADPPVTNRCSPTCPRHWLDKTSFFLRACLFYYRASQWILRDKQCLFCLPLLDSVSEVNQVRDSAFVLLPGIRRHILMKTILGCIEDSGGYQSFQCLHKKIFSQHFLFCLAATSVPNAPNLYYAALIGASQINRRFHHLEPTLNHQNHHPCSAKLNLVFLFLSPIRSLLPIPTSPLSFSGRRSQISALTYIRSGHLVKLHGRLILSPLPKVNWCLKPFLIWMLNQHDWFNCLR